MAGNTDAMKALAKALESLNPATDKAVRQRMSKAGDIIADQARANASWSHKIPRTIRSTVFRGTSVRVTAGYKSVPIARWYELGRTNASAIWRHPVFPSSKWALKGIGEARKHWHWATQRDPKRPYLKPALEQSKEQVAKVLLNAIIDTAEEYIDGVGHE